jgi:hypothetical protein
MQEDWFPPGNPACLRSELMCSILHLMVEQSDRSGLLGTERMQVLSCVSELLHHLDEREATGGKYLRPPFCPRGGCNAKGEHAACAGCADTAEVADMTSDASQTP